MQELLGYSFFTNALIGVILIAVASAMIGTYVVTRRLVAITGGVTHACFGGLGLGYYLGWNPLAVAAAVAVGAALGVEWMSARRQVREDSAIAVIWSAGMAAGVVFVFLTPGYVPELNAFLFGNILNISTADLWLFAAFTLLVGAIFTWKFQQIVTCAFDRDFAHVTGMPVALVNGAMTVLTALCVVLTIRLVGIMLLMAMFTLPQMTAELFWHRFKSIMTGSALISAAGSTGGVLLSAYIDVPCSALIVISLGIIYAGGRILLRLRQARCGRNGREAAA